MEWLLDCPTYLQWIIVILTACVYGGVIGLIPSAGPSKAVILLFAIVSLFDFPGGNYLFVLFSITTVVACSIGDSFSGVLLGIPGANSSAATMVDGYPLAKQGRASYALSAAITVSTVNGLLFGFAGMMIIPYYSAIAGVVGVPEIFALVVLSLSMISVITTNDTFRSLCAVGFGFFVGSIGYDMMGSSRNTFGWEYLEDGVPIVIVAAGLFAIPEIWESITNRIAAPKTDIRLHNQQTWEGMWAVWRNRWISLQGGVIGFVIGLLPGIGGGVSDWIGYSATVATNKKESVKFGEGNIKGLIGCEGTNNSGQMGALLPTIMFGIPGGKTFAILMALWLYVGFEVGNSFVMNDKQFIDHLIGGYMIGTAFAGVVMLLFARQFTKIVYINPRYYMPVMLALTVWAVLASRYYASVWEDLSLLAVFGAIGFACKKYKFSRPAMLMAFILWDRVETSLNQMAYIFFWDDLKAVDHLLETGSFDLLLTDYFINNSIWSEHPFMTTCLVLAVCIVIYGIFNKTRNMSYV